jgi:hypothetical protein
MESYDEYARRAKLMATVHAPTSSAAVSVCTASSCASEVAASSSDKPGVGAEGPAGETVVKKKKASGSGASKKKSLKRL